LDWRCNNLSTGTVLLYFVGVLVARRMKLSVVQSMSSKTTLQMRCLLHVGYYIVQNEGNDLSKHILTFQTCLTMS
jgi:hypothetical protein